MDFLSLAREFLSQGDMPIELIGSTPTYLGMGIKIVFAVTLGTILGMERESKLKAAGIKTNMLICVGAAIYTSISLMTLEGNSIADPNRMAAQVVSGIGFLGAGAIIKDRGDVLGMTSAAGIWVAASIGVAVGMGYPVMATLFTFTVIFMLRVTYPMIRVFQREKVFAVEVISRGDVTDLIEKFFRQDGDDCVIEKQMISEKEYVYHFETQMNPKTFKDVIFIFQDYYQVKSINFIRKDEGVHKKLAS